MRQHFVLFVLIAGAFSTQALAQTPPCSQAEASERWDRASEMGMILGTSMLNRTPTVHVPRADWRSWPTDVRIGLIETMDCVAGGGDTFFAAINVVDEGGRVLARWDGRRRQIEIIE